MPLYEYECEEHGVFELCRSMADCTARAPCPTCDVASARILSAPNLALVTRATALARDRNERSAHEPKLVTKSVQESSRAEPPTAARSAACGGGRPWMLGH